MVRHRFSTNTSNTPIHTILVGVVQIKKKKNYKLCNKINYVITEMKHS